MTIALAPPICGDDVPVALVNKSLQKIMPILIEKSKFIELYSFWDQRKSKGSVLEDIDFDFQTSSSRHQYCHSGIS